MTIRTLFSAAALAAATPALAQETPEAPASLVRGNHAFSFDVPSSGGGAVGAWANLRDRTQLGLRLGLNLHANHDTSNDSLASRRQQQGFAQVALELRRFHPVSATVAPFVSATVFSGYSRQHATQGGNAARQTFWNTGAGIGVGVEWFPVPAVSLGGRLGLDASYGHSRIRSGFGGTESVSTSSSFDLSTGTSALSLKIYF
jgi:hypothetical protein